MSTTTPLRGTVTALSFAGADSTLASGDYAVSSAVDCTSLGSGAIAADDALLTVSVGIAATATAGDVISVFVLSSIDGTTFSDGPADGSSDTTHDANMRLLATLSVPSAAAATLVLPATAIAPLFGGWLPHSVKVVVYNGSGAALTSLAGSIQGLNESIA